MKLQLLLEQLADGEFHSGSSLGELLGVSRTAIWKSLTLLTDYGIEFESVKGKGYRLLKPLELLDASKILADLAPYKECVNLTVLEKTESTNAYLAQSDRAKNGGSGNNNGGANKTYEVCLAEYQTAGRGRRGRNWVSPFGRNIYMSVAFDLQGGVDALSGLSLVVGLAVVRALKELGVPGAKIKWPNDVWIEERKVCGILVELQGEATTSWRVIVGVGLNVEMDERDAGVAGIDQSWVSLGHYANVSRNQVASKLMSHLFGVLSEFQKQGFKGFVDEWCRADVLFGREIAINGDKSGEAAGVDEQGGLLIRLASGELESINAGEVSVRCQ